MIALVVGVPGVGKSTVVEEARRHVDINVVNYGDIFLEVARELYSIEQRDDIRKRLTADQYKSLHREAARRIREMADKPLVLDTHALIALETGFMPGFPKFVLEELPISLIVVVEASPEEIMARRARDARNRGEGLESNVELHQQLDRAAVVVYAVEKGASMYFIRNEEGRVQEAGRELAEVLRKWMSGFG